MTKECKKEEVYDKYHSFGRIDNGLKLNSLKMMVNNINKPTNIYDILINFNTGIEVPYSRQAFLGLIADDKPLLLSFKELSVEEAEQKWYKTAQIYNDRHPLSISKN
jgi:hypothetical protein